MKLHELIGHLQTIDAAQGGDSEVNVGLNHPEDGFTEGALDLVDATSFEPTVMLFGGEVELAQEDPPTEEELLEQAVSDYQRRADAFTGEHRSILDFEERAACLALAEVAQQRLRLLAVERAQTARLTRVLLEREAATLPDGDQDPA